MPALPVIALFIVAAIGLLLIPGPAIVYIVTRSVEQGRQAGLASVLGIELASLAHAMAAAFGLSAILLASALAFSVVKYIGAAYLIFLGLRALLKREQSEQLQILYHKPLRQLTAQGFLVNLLNPKTALFFYAFLPQFVDPNRGSVIVQILIFGLIFVLLASCTDSLFALLASTAGRVLRKSTRIKQIQRYVTGCIYITLGVVTALTGSERK